MPLLSEFISYQSWENAAKRWKNPLYNRPVSSAVEYFINNLKNSEKILDRGAGDFLKCHFRKEMDQNDNLLTSGGSYGEIGYEWMFRILKGKYKERPA